MEGGLQDIEPFELSATLVNDTVIMDAKLNKKILEDLTFEYKGVYDPMIKTGYVLITKEDIKNFKEASTLEKIRNEIAANRRKTTTNEIIFKGSDTPLEVTKDFSSIYYSR